MECFEYCCPTQTLFGFGCRAAMGGVIKKAGWQKALVVTDHTLIRLGIVGRITELLDAGGVPFALFGEVKPNPTIANVDAGLAVLKESGCDFILSIGGGSAHDCAKAIGILAANGGTVRDYIGVDKSAEKSVPIVAVNTTAGTASECTRAYVIVDEENGLKIGIKDRNALVTLAVNDHELMMGLPKDLTAGTGMDALTHAVECYTSTRGYLLPSELALAAIRQVFANLPGAVENGDEASRGGMAVAQYLAGLAFGNASCGMVHSMSHQLSAVYDLPHGLCNAILLPAVMRFNSRDAAARQKYAEIALAVFPLESAGKSTAQQAELFIQRVEELSAQVGTRVALSTLGVKPEDVGLMADKAIKDSSIPGNPVLPAKEQIEALYMELI